MTTESNLLAAWHLERLRGGASDADPDLIRETWPDAPLEDLAALPSWLRNHPDAAEAVAKVNPEGPPPPPQPEGWRIYTLADAYAPRPPLQYVVDGLFALPSLSIVYGAPGCFKTMLMADLAACVAAGCDWLPALPDKDEHTERTTLQVPALWLDFDNGVRTMHERIEAVARARDLPPETPLFYVSMPNPWLDASDFASVTDLAELALRLGARLIILDNLRDVAGGVEENSAAMGDVMSNFRRLAEDTGAAVILVHHQRKASGFKSRSGDSLRGHSSIEAALDLALLIEREEHADTVQVKATKVRGADVFPFGAKFTYEWREGTTELAKVKFFGVEVEDVSTDAAIRRAILEAVEVEPGINKGTLVKTVRENGIEAGRNRVSLLIDSLVSDGRLVVTSGERKAKLYNLPREKDHREVTLV